MNDLQQPATRQLASPGGAFLVTLSVGRRSTTVHCVGLSGAKISLGRPHNRQLIYTTGMCRVRTQPADCRGQVQVSFVAKASVDGRVSAVQYVS
jgi:hypothetical protein